MITNKGKEIVGKYLLGQVNDYAAYIAVGCGAKPLTSADNTDHSDRTELDFEMFRAPIIARGTISENGVQKLVFKAELPRDQQYKISEVGLFPAEYNARAASYGSKMLASFNIGENWKYSSDNIALTYQTGLIVEGASIIDTIGTCYVGDDNGVWAQPPRKEHLEFPRMGNVSVVSDCTAGPQTIKTDSIQLDLGKNSGDDIIKLAFVAINRAAGQAFGDNNLNLTLTFYNADKKKATVTELFDLTDPETVTQRNHYKIWSIPLKDFTADPGYLWSSIVSIEITIDPIDKTTLVALDGLRLENVTTENPIYGLVGYNVLTTSTGQPVLKLSNTSNFIEYRFGLNIQ